MHKKRVKGVNFDAGNFSLIEYEVLDMMPSVTHFWQNWEILRSGSKPTISMYTTPTQALE